MEQRSASTVQPEIEESWKKNLSGEFGRAYFQKLKAFLLEEKSRHLVFPPGNRIFSAFNLTPFDKVKVVILGQDPYHGPGQAHGLCFSVPEGVKTPPSLINIYKEIASDLGNVPDFKNGNLEFWASQGVLLLNATLTVRAGAAGSHQKKGWEIFTDAVISVLSERKKNLVFLLWGRFAADKARFIDKTKHHILTAAHPSPLSAHNGFFGCRHFSRCNEILISTGQEPVKWVPE